MYYYIQFKDLSDDELQPIVDISHINVFKQNLLCVCKETFLIEYFFNTHELANMIGTSRETVNRTINQLRKKETDLY